MPESVEEKILANVAKRGRGSVVWVTDFLSYGSRKAVNKALERLTDRGVLLRVARGIYAYPRMEKVYGLGPISPSPDEIARAVAERDGANIVPSGLYAQYRLGLTQQVPMNVVYLTDGPSRTLRVEGGGSIIFKRSSPRYFALRSSLSRLLVPALKDWTVDALSPEQVSTLKDKLNGSPRLPISDLKLMPSDMREFILGLYE